MEFEKTNENVTVNESFTGQNENYQYDFQVGYLNGKLVSVTCVIHKLVDAEIPNPEGDPVIQKQPQRLGYISQLDSVKKEDGYSGYREYRYPCGCFRGIFERVGVKLYIRWGSLSKFRRLYETNEFLQSVLENETGIRWEFDESDKIEIEKLLKGIKHEMV